MKIFFGTGLYNDKFNPKHKEKKKLRNFCFVYKNKYILLSNALLTFYINYVMIRKDRLTIPKHNIYRNKFIYLFKNFAYNIQGSVEKSIKL